MVETVKYHARSLVLLAPHINKLGIRQTKEKIAHIMAEIDRKFPNERKKSLFASVELSLQRLSVETREKIEVLGVFYGGAHLSVLAMMLEMNDEEIGLLAQKLINTGLAEMMPYGHLRLHPALCPYLNRQLNEMHLAQFQVQWAEGMKQLAGFLYEQKFQNTQLQATLTVLELPNFLALLAYLQKQDNSEETVQFAVKIEGVLQFLGRPHIMKTVSDIREQESKKIGDWNRTNFQAAASKIERLLESGNLQQAFQEAQALKDKTLQAGEQAYPGADYDIAIAIYLVGQVLFSGDASQEAIKLFIESQRRFQILADKDDKTAERMVSVLLARQGDCLLLLGRLDESAAAYEKGIELSEKLDDARQVAAAKANLGQVRLNQKRYQDAFDAYESARKIFENFGEACSIATAWHQIGIVHEEIGNFDPAEQAYRKSLAIEVQQKNSAGEASSLLQLGNLHDKFGRLEEAAIFNRQAADKYVEINDMANEGRARNNIANTLIKLNRYDEARQEILRAIECYKSYAHAVQPWTTWDTLHDLEQAVGNTTAAAQAREKAMELFLAYRRDGGENHSDGGRLCFAFAQAVEAGQTDEIREHLKQYSPHPLVSALQAILSGSRDPALASDPALDYQNAVEVKLLLERLGKS
ncbi:MAG: tetratricopeptide repeat protein [Desulfobacteraceae bacterium]|nr:tetratricopeptide repeat protein [Desulfobacteraceae bacterium]